MTVRDAERPAVANRKFEERVLKLAALTPPLIEYVKVSLEFCGIREGKTKDFSAGNKEERAHRSHTNQVSCAKNGDNLIDNGGLRTCSAGKTHVRLGEKKKANLHAQPYKM